MDGGRGGGGRGKDGGREGGGGWRGEGGKGVVLSAGFSLSASKPTR